jgi:hypothetical protein
VQSITEINRRKPKMKIINIEFAPVAMVLGLLFGQVAKAGLLETQSNPVNFGGLYWGNPTNWDTLNIPKYQLDTASDGTHNRDLNFISIAHDAHYFYVRINCSEAPQFGGDFNLWLDTDHNSATGARNWSGNGSIGSEYLVTGAALIQEPYTWILAGWAGWDQNPWDAGEIPRDVIFSINRTTQMPGVDSFDFTFQFYNSGDSATGDWYPDSADSQSGDFFRYTTADLAGPAPTSTSDTYRNLVLSDDPLAYYRLNETAAPSPDVATNSSVLGKEGNGTYTTGVERLVTGAIVADGDTAAHFSAVDTNSTDGGVPAIVLWPEQPMIRELWDSVGVGWLDSKGDGTSSVGFDSGANWHVNLGHLIKVAANFDITTPPGPPYSRGSQGGVWADNDEIGGLAHYWDTGSWATRQLAPAAQINFAADGEYWITMRIDNSGDTAMGIGFADAGDGSAHFVGVGALWNSAGGGSANNALYVSDGTLGTDSPYAIRANSSAEIINGPGLIVARLTTSAAGMDRLDATVFYPGDVIPSNSSSISWQVGYDFDSSMTATHLLAWLNGQGVGQLDAIRVTKSFNVMFEGAMNTRGSFTIEAWLRPTIEGAGNAQSPLFNRDPDDNVVNRAGWDFFQRDSGTGWNFRMFNGSGSDKVFDITGGPYTVGQWCHLVAVYDASVPSATLYLNGEQVAFFDTPNGSYVPTPYAPLSIGGYSDASQNPFTGDIDEVAIYTNALDAANVLAHYQNGTNSSRSVSYSSLVLSDNPIEYLRLNEPAKNVAVNSGSLGGAANGAIGLHVLNGRSGPRSPGQPGFESGNAAAFFNGGDSFVELRNVPDLNFIGAITLEAWVQPSLTPGSQGGYGNIIAHGYDEDFNEVALRVNGNSEYAISTYRQWEGQGVSASIPAADLATGAWVHLVGTYDGANWNLYRNGVPLASAADTASSPGSLMVLKGNWAIGARGRWAHMDVLGPGLDRQFQGKIDEAAIYDRALSPDEVLAHYYVGVSNNPPITISTSGGDVTLTWPVGVLQQADEVVGLYTDVGATSPYTIPASAAKKFYRVKL